MAEEPSQSGKKAPCLSCRHYFITWEQRHPYGCRAFGFKSKLMPCLDVKAASSLHCLKYEAREEKP